MREAKPASELGKPKGLFVRTVEIDGTTYALIRHDKPRLGLPSCLTSAEGEVCVLVAGGASNADIAQARGTSSRTVANQISRILEKLGAASRDDIVRALLEAGADGATQ
jgi:DNA-binding CsgD family transcriptional regulator